AEALGTEPWPSPLRRQTGDLKHLSKCIKKAMRSEGGFERAMSRTALVLGSLVLGEAAERIFRSIYEEKLSNTDIKLVDLRTKRNDTDYRLLNGNDRPLYRLNIKLHGSLFRKARELVGLDPSDCFPLATYKIKSALDKQDEEH